MFGSRVGFSGSADRMVLFRLHQIQVGGRPPFWIISNGHISATAHSIHLYSAHRAVIFAIAQLSCYCLRLRESMTHSVLTFVNFGCKNLHIVYFSLLSSD